MDKNIVVGLDISTKCIGVCVLLNDETDHGKIVDLTHVTPKLPSKIKGMESLFLKKKIFTESFLSKWKDYGIKRVVIEAPLVSSNNTETVATLLKFNGMISDAVYNELGIVPEYISSYDARKFAFPELMSIRRANTKGEAYPMEKIKKSIEEGKFVLFGDYPFDIDKKQVIQSKVKDIFPEIEWLYDNNGLLKKENFDACDAYVACIGFLNKERHGSLEMSVNEINVMEKNIEVKYSYWNLNKTKNISFL